MDYQEYKDEFLDSLRTESAISGTDTEDEFLHHVLDLLVDFNEIDSPVLTGMGEKKAGSRLMRVDGYSFDETERSLILFISDFQDLREPDKLTRSRVDELYWRMFYFLDEVCNGNMKSYFDDSDDLLRIAALLRKRVTAEKDDPDIVLKIKFWIFTNKELDTRLLSANLLETTVRSTRGRKKKTTTTKRIKLEEYKGKPLEMALWYPERFFEMENSNRNEPVVIDVPNDYNYAGIPCIKGDIGDNTGYEAYIAIIPGKLLADIYLEHGSRVLEGNVRAFLGTGGNKSVNSGIRRTINTEATKFFTYNNGIATTAADVETDVIDGKLYITKIVDFQIINGGQTTATLAEAVLKKTNIGLEGIFVPMKLTVIEDRETENENGISDYDAMVQSIAKYANSQNRVTAADLFSNDPFHVRMEIMSKKIFAPPVRYPVPTGWYYERARKKYNQEQVKLSKDEQKRFQAKFPKFQVITKEQLAMYHTAVFSVRPDIVSRGKNWAMKKFGEEIGELYRKDKNAVNPFYFRKCVCAAIIYRTVDNYLETHKDSANRPTGFWYKTGGYKLNIVPYTIAKILSSIPQGFTVNWEMIWSKQSLSPAFMNEIEIVTKMTNDFICESGGVIVTEYCKKQSTWEDYKANVIYELSSDFLSELVSIDSVNEQEHYARSDTKEENNLQSILDIINRGADYWLSLIKIARDNHFSVSYQDTTAIQQLADMASSGKVPITSAGKVPSKVTKAVQIALALEDKLVTEGLLKVK